MKKYHLLAVLLILSLTVGIFAFKSDDDQETKASVVIVKVIMIPNVNSSTIQIYRADVKVEEIELAKLPADSQQLNWQVVTSTLNKLVNEGYRVSSSSVNGENSVYGTFILTR